MEENKYATTWAHRAWFASGCTTLLISYSKSILLTPTPRAWPDLALAAALGYLLADLVSGVYHWAVDNYGSARTPVFGSQIESFRAHHQHPSEITKCETAGIAYTLAGVTTAAVTPFNLISRDSAILAFVGVFGTKFHAWAHLPKKKLPPLAAALHSAEILIRLSQHTSHHRPLYNITYCTVSGIWNRVLDGSRVLVGVEVWSYSVDRQFAAWMVVFRRSSGDVRHGCGSPEVSDCAEFRQICSVAGSTR